MNVTEALVLGVVQGLTEFLPVSSSGHLVIFGDLLGIRDATISLDVLVHVGTLTAVFAVFWPDIVEVMKAMGRLARAVTSGKAAVERQWRKDPYTRLLAALFAGTVPVAAIGYLWEDHIAGLFGSLALVGLNLLLTGVMLWYAGKAGKRHRGTGDVSLRQGLFVGVFQVLALAPGVSRSGATISGGLYAGLSKETAARFSFLLSIPAISGAALLQIPDFLGGTVTTAVGMTGFVVSAISGYVAIKVLLGILKTGRLQVFAYYTWGLGAVILGLTLI